MIEAHDVEHSKAFAAHVAPKLRPWLDAIAGAALGCVLAAGISVAGDPVHATAVYVAGTVVVAGALAVASSAVGGRRLIPVGVACFAIAAWLLPQVSYPAGALFIAPLVGIGGGMAAPGNPARFPRGAAGALFAAAFIVLVRLVADRNAAMVVAAIIVAAAGIAAWWRDGSPTRSLMGGAGLALGASMVALVTVAWTGANTPTATWFGSLASHGPRDSNQVAITFDDGPNAPYTMDIRRAARCRRDEGHLLRGRQGDRR